MPDRSYVGIDRNRHNEWEVVLWDGDRIWSRVFKNTWAELGELVLFIAGHGRRPRICLNPTSPAALKLIKSVGGIPDAEVLLLSAEGMRLHRPWLRGDARLPGGDEARALFLARCAERII